MKLILVRVFFGSSVVWVSWLGAWLFTAFGLPDNMWYCIALGITSVMVLVGALVVSLVVCIMSVETLNEKGD